MLPNFDTFFPKEISLQVQSDLAKSLSILLTVALDEMRSNAALREKFASLVTGSASVPSLSGDVTGSLSAYEAGYLMGEIINDPSAMERILDGDLSVLNEKWDEFKKENSQILSSSGVQGSKLPKGRERLINIAKAVGSGDVVPEFLTTSELLGSIELGLSELAGEIDDDDSPSLGYDALEGSPKKPRKTIMGKLLQGVTKFITPGIQAGAQTIAAQTADYNNSITASFMPTQSQGSGIMPYLPSPFPKTPQVIASNIEVTISEAQGRLNLVKTALDAKNQEMENNRRSMGRLNTALSALKADDLMAEAMFQYPIDFSTPDALAHSLRPILELNSTSLWSRLKSSFGFGDIDDGEMVSNEDFEFNAAMGDITSEFLNKVGSTLGDVLSGTAKGTKEVWDGMSTSGKLATGGAVGLAALAALGPGMAKNAMLMSILGGNSNGNQTPADLASATALLNAMPSGMPVAVKGPESSIGPSPELLKYMASIGEQIREYGAFRPFDKLTVGTGDVIEANRRVPIHALIEGELVAAPFFHLGEGDVDAFEGGLKSFFKKAGRAIASVAKPVASAALSFVPGAGPVANVISKVAPRIFESASKRVAAVAPVAAKLLAPPGNVRVMPPLIDQAQFTTNLFPNPSQNVSPIQDFLRNQVQMPASNGPVSDMSRYLAASPPPPIENLSYGLSQSGMSPILPRPYANIAYAAPRFPDINEWMDSAPDMFGDISDVEFIGNPGAIGLGARFLSAIPGLTAKAANSMRGYWAAAKGSSAMSKLGTFWGWVRSGGSWFAKRSFGSQVMIAISGYSLVSLIKEKMRSSPSDDAIIRDVLGPDYSRFSLLVSKPADQLSEEEQYELALMLVKLEQQAPDLTIERQSPQVLEAASNITAVEPTTGSFADMDLASLWSKMQPYMPVLVATLGAGTVGFLISKMLKKAKNEPEMIIPVSFTGEPVSDLGIYLNPQKDFLLGDIYEAVAGDITSIIRNGYARYPMDYGTSRHDPDDFMSQL